MRIILLLFCFGITYVCTAQSLSDLNFLIGEWEVREIIYPGTAKEYTETSTRKCTYILDSTYIQCETKAITSRGKKRTYLFLINYLKEPNHFMMRSLYSDLSQQGSYILYLNIIKSELQIISHFDNFERDGFLRSKIDFKDKKQLIWEGWSSKFNQDKDWNYIYKEVAIKKE